MEKSNGDGATSNQEMDVRTKRVADEILGQYAVGKLTRRDVIVRGTALGLSLSVLGPLLAACGGDEDTTAPAEEAAPPEEAPPAEEAMVPQRGGTYTEGYHLTFAKMDNVFGPWADEPFPALFDHVILRDADGTIVPGIAESWEVSPDGLTATLKIRDGLIFQSGDPLTAANVAEDFELQRTEGVNVGFLEAVDSFEEGEGGTVVVNLIHPWWGLFDILTTQWMMIHNDKARVAAGDTYGTEGTVDGSGPFILDTFRPETEVVVTRWDDYPGTVIPFLENKGPAYVDAIRWVVILEESNRSNEVETGSVDGVRLPAPQDIDRLQANEDLVVIEFTDLGNFFLALNWTKEDLGFADPRVHQAISHAIDRQALVDTLYFGHAVPTPGPLYPSYKWYQSEVEAFNAFDPERSNSLLEEAGVGPMSFEVWTQPLPIQVRMLEAVSGMLADVGIDMSIRQLENVEFFPGLPESDAFTFKWLFNGEVAAIQFFMKFPSVEYYGDVPQSRQAIIDWENAGTLEEYERTDRALQVVFAEELPYIPILSPTNVYVHNKRVHGLRPNGQMIYPQFNDVWVEQ